MAETTLHVVDNGVENQVVETQGEPTPIKPEMHFVSNRVVLYDAETQPVEMKLHVEDSRVEDSDNDPPSDNEDNEIKLQPIPSDPESEKYAKDRIAQKILDSRCPVPDFSTSEYSFEWDRYAIFYGETTGRILPYWITKSEPDFRGRCAILINDGTFIYGVWRDNNDWREHGNWLGSRRFDGTIEYANGSKFTGVMSFRFRSDSAYYCDNFKKCYEQPLKNSVITGQMENFSLINHNQIIIQQPDGKHIYKMGKWTNGQFQGTICLPNGTLITGGDFNRWQTSDYTIEMPGMTIKGQFNGTTPIQWVFVKKDGKYEVVSEDTFKLPESILDFEFWTFRSDF